MTRPLVMPFSFVLKQKQSPKNKPLQRFVKQVFLWKINCSARLEPGTKKNLSPQQELNPWPPEHRVGALFTELRNKWKAMLSSMLQLSSYVTGVLRTRPGLAKVIVCSVSQTYGQQKGTLMIEELLWLKNSFEEIRELDYELEISIRR